MFKPLGNKILVERVIITEPVYNGIIIPDTILEKPMEGVVIAIGTGSKDKKIQPNISVGDRVIFGKWAGEDIKIQNKDYTLIDFDSVIGVVK